ncbi:heme-binding protein [Acidocella sp. C78]|uniref:SOUL family heme-binding protein n=1 Tax=Acidocella sp. C78 TaxID=1671486 RepID=UPI00191BB751|nr:heme-binding protein [Acidocella sp. C78]
MFGIRSGTPQPGYTVTGRVGAVQIRNYGPRLAAETTVEGGEIGSRSTGFRKLASYIFGANTRPGGGSGKIAMTAPVEQAGAGGSRIAMTAPVAQQGSNGRWTIRFFLPAGMTMATAPRPHDPSVQLVEIPAETMAVLRFSGSPGAGSVAAHSERLLATLAHSPWQPEGSVVAWFYDPPWTLPWLRRNEVAVPVEHR